MPLTIEQALKEIPVLSAARVMAGEQNLGQIIRWTHIIDHPDVVPWVQEGYLLLTTAFALMLNPDSQVDLIPRLAEKKLAGMMVNVGRYMGEIPSNMIAAAQKWNFPLIALPWEVNFTEVTYAIHERIINEQYALSEQVFHIHEVLTQIVIEGGGLDTLASRLADLLQRSITIEDASFSLLAYKSIEPIDSVRSRSIAEGRTPAEVVAYHTHQGLYERLRHDRRPQKVDPIPEIGLTLERVIAPIMVGPHLLGYIWVIATDHALTGLDFLAIERAANVAALILSREQAVYEAEQRVKTQLFESLLDPHSSKDSYELTDMLQKLGLSIGYQILVLEGRSNQPQIVQTRVVDSFIHSRDLDALMVERGGRLVIILGSGSNQKGAEIAAQLLTWTAERRCGFAIGFSALASGTSQIRAAYEEAMSALRAGSAFTRDGSEAWSYESLGYILGLLNLPDEFRRANHYRALIACLSAYDEKHGTRLLKTLDVYINQLADIRKTSQELFIHRNTLYQRLEKIKLLCQVNLQDTLTVFNLYLALKDWNIQKQSPSS